MQQYLFDVPKLMQVEAPTDDDILEDPCQGEEDGEGEGEVEGLRQTFYLYVPT